MRRSRQTKARLIRMGIAVFSLLIALIFLGMIQAIRSSQQSQLAADRWRGKSDRPFSQISLFLSSDAGFTDHQAAGLDQSIQTALDAISNTDRWYSCFSSEAPITLTGLRNSVQVQATAVGGDFFLLHDFHFLSGSFFTEEDFTPNRIVLDHNAAWQLFGAYDLTGKSITLGELELTIAGVVDSLPSGMFRDTLQTAYGQRPRVYIPYSLLKQLDERAVITCYEAVIPEPLDDFASTTIQNHLPVDKHEAELLVNSSRYDLIPLFSTISGLWIRSMRTNRIVYPWWENVAGVAEDCAALCQLIMVIFASISLILMLIAALRFLHQHPVTLRPIVNWLDNLHDRRLRRNWEKKQARQNQPKS